MNTDITCPPGTHRVETATTAGCVPNHEPPPDVVHPVPVADTLSLTGLALVMLVLALTRRKTK